MFQHDRHTFPAVFSQRITSAVQTPICNQGTLTHRVVTGDLAHRQIRLDFTALLAFLYDPGDQFIVIPVVIQKVSLPLGNQLRRVQRRQQINTDSGYQYLSLHRLLIFRSLILCSRGLLATTLIQQK